MKTNWDLTHLFSQKKDWEMAKNRLAENVKKWENSFDTMLNDISSFERILKEKIEIDRNIERVYCYPKRFTDLDSSDKEHQEMVREAWGIYENILEVNKKFLSLLRENPTFVDNFLDTSPYYKRCLDVQLHENIFVLSGEIETLKEIYRTLTEVDLSFGSLELESGEVVSLNRKTLQDILSSSCASDRIHAFEKQNEAYKRIENTLSVLLYHKYRIEVEQAHKKGKKLLEKVLDEAELPHNIMEHVIQVANQNIPLQQEYIELKKNVLGLEEFHISDMALPFGTISKMEVEVEDAIEMLKHAFSVFGESYVAKIDQAFQEGWVDVYPSKYKRKMSYSCISYEGVPYASLNYNKSITSVRTLGHELGHSIHTSYAKEENAFEYFEYSLFLSEIVSKVNEILLNEYLLKQDLDIVEKKYLLNNIVASLGNTLFGQVMHTEFEYSILSLIEQNKKIDANLLNQTYRDLFLKYHGDLVILDVDNSNAWARLPHFMMNNAYYLYQYPVGVSLAIEIVKRIHEDEGFVDKYLKFLKIGNRLNVSDSLSTLDIDLTDTVYLENSYRYLEEKIVELKRLKS